MSMSISFNYCLVRGPIYTQFLLSVFTFYYSLPFFLHFPEFSLLKKPLMAFCFLNIQVQISYHKVLCGLALYYLAWHPTVPPCLPLGFLPVKCTRFFLTTQAFEVCNVLCRKTLLRRLAHSLPSGPPLSDLPYKGPLSYYITVLFFFSLKTFLKNFLDFYFTLEYS